MVEWMRIPISGVEWRVLLATTEEYPDLADRDGETDTEKCQIIIQASLPRDKRGVVLIHEIIHAAFSTPGEDALMAKILGIKEQRVEEAEELFVTHLAPKLTDALTRAKLLRLPRTPKAVSNAADVDTKGRRRAARRRKVRA